MVVKELELISYLLHLFGQIDILQYLLALFAWRNLFTTRRCLIAGGGHIDSHWHPIFFYSGSQFGHYPGDTFLLLN